MEGKPSKTIETIKKAVRILAVGSTLAGAPADARSVKHPEATPPTAASQTYNGWRLSKNIEDARAEDGMYDEAIEEAAKRDEEEVQARTLRGTLNMSEEQEAQFNERAGVLFNPTPSEKVAPGPLQSTPDVPKEEELEEKATILFDKNSLRGSK